MAVGLGDVALVGSTHSAGTLRIKEFLMRNGHPYSYIDLERDPEVQNLLDGFPIAASDIPVVICRGKLMLRNPTNQQVADCLGFNETIDQTQMRDVEFNWASRRISGADDQARTPPHQVRRFG